MLQFGANLGFPCEVRGILDRNTQVLGEFREFPQTFSPPKKVGDQKAPFNSNASPPNASHGSIGGVSKEAKERKLEGLVERQSEVGPLFFFNRKKRQKKGGPKRGDMVYYC